MVEILSIWALFLSIALVIVSLSRLLSDLSFKPKVIKGEKWEIRIITYKLDQYRMGLKVILIENNISATILNEYLGEFNMYFERETLSFRFEIKNKKYIAYAKRIGALEFNVWIEEG